MTKTFIQTTEFSRNWDRLGFKDADLQRLELDLLQKANTYPVMQGTGGLREMRFALENEGKRIISVKLKEILSGR